MQINLDANKLITGLITTVVIGVFTFLWTMNNRVTTLEQGKDLTERVEKIENALLPVLVEYKLQQEIKKIAPPPPPPGITPLPDFVPFSPNNTDQEFLRGEAEKWAKEQIPNVAQQPINGNFK